MRNGAGVLATALSALASSRGVVWECIVVDDGSTDDSAEVARQRGATVLRSTTPGSGPGLARNVGALAARSALLCFLDADVVARPNTLAQFVALFDEHPSLTAAFGSYDTEPAASNLLSQYRNLLHHFVHQTARPAASTFWSGCGAIRREDFLLAGGFSAEYTKPSIEDIELGYRLRSEGHEIQVAKHIQVTHLKKWTLGSILRTDIRDRALPWTELIHRYRHMPNDLNLQTSGRVSALCVMLVAGFFGAGWLNPRFWLACLASVAVLFVCNRDLYQFFLRHRGPWFLTRVLPMHWFYYLYSSAAFVWGTLRVYRREWAHGRRLNDRPARPPSRLELSLKSVRDPELPLP